MASESISVIMDQFRGDTALEDQAAEDGIEIILVPNGATRQYQPLNLRTFGALKYKDKAKGNSRFSQQHGAQCTKEIGGAFLLQPRVALGISLCRGSETNETNRIIRMAS
jgi:hypothetical protein